MASLNDRRVAGSDALEPPDEPTIPLAAPPPEPALGVTPPPLAMAPRRRFLKPGDEVDQFEITGLLGRGGMGEVFLARDRVLGREVALKIVSPELLVETSAIDRFRVEARATAKLNHPNIVTIHGIGEVDGRPYVALERLTGRTLRDRLQAGPLPYEEALAIGVAIANALACAHEARVFHRDLKPSNVMLCEDGRHRVLDFGLAKIADGDSSSIISIGSSSALAAGTPSYMAPEQWRMEKAGAPTDLWALGVMLFEMCAHTRPYHAIEEHPKLGHYERILALQDKVGSDEPVPGFELLAEVPPELVDLLGACLRKQPERRPTAAAVSERLRALLGPVTLGASGSFYPPARSSMPAPASRAAESAADPLGGSTDLELLLGSRRRKRNLLVASVLAATVLVALLIFWATQP